MKTKNKKKKIFSPSIYAILLALMLLVIVISWIVYWANGSIQDGDYHPAGIFELFMAPVKGFINSAGIIIFLFSIAAFLKVVNSSKALDAGIGHLFKKLKGKEIVLIITLFVVFAVCGTTFGACEIVIPFYFLLIPVLIAAGFDTFTALLVICFGAGIGTLASTINPILIQTAFDAANGGIHDAWPLPEYDSWESIPTSTGIIWRLVSLVVLMIFVISYMCWYVLRIKKNPNKSFTVHLAGEHKEKFAFSNSMVPELTTKRIWVLIIFALTFVMLIVGSIPWWSFGLNGFEWLTTKLHEWFPYLFGDSYGIDSNEQAIQTLGKWGIAEMAFLFFIASFVVGLLNWRGEKDFGRNIIDGASEFVGIAFIIAIASGFSVILESTGLQRAMIDGIQNAEDAMPTQAFTLVLYITFFVISIFLPSMSGFSKAIFPTMGPALSGMTQATVNGAGMTVSGSILTFSMTNGLVNLMAPTGAAFVIGLQICEIPLGRFYRCAWPLLLGIALLSITLLMIGTVLPGPLF